jgi:hypothetical protein
MSMRIYRDELWEPPYGLASQNGTRQSHASASLALKSNRRTHPMTVRKSAHVRWSPEAEVDGARPMREPTATQQHVRGMQ